MAQDNIPQADALAALQAESMLGLLSDLWHQGVTQRFFQQVLDVGIALLPPAQAGSIMLRQGQCYRYIAACGYDLQALSKVTLPARVLDALLTSDWSAFCLHDLDGLNADHLDSQSQGVLQTAGRTDAIQETLVLPIGQHKQTLAVLTLDNFDGVGAFCDRDMVMAQRLGVLLGLGLKLQKDEQALPPAHEAPSLGQRDKDVLQGICEGLTDKQMAERLGLEVTTTRNYVRRLYKKIGVHSRAQATRWALEHGWIAPHNNSS